MSRYFQHLNLSRLPTFFSLNLDECHLLTFRQCLVFLIAHNGAIVNKQSSPDSLTIKPNACISRQHSFCVIKMRESMVDVHTEKLTGTIEIDAAYVNKHVRRANKVEQRVDRRKAENQNPKKRAMVVIRQRSASNAFASLGVSAPRSNPLRSATVLNSSRLLISPWLSLNTSSNS